MKKVFISQPMDGLSDDKIKAKREEIIQRVNDTNFLFRYNNTYREEGIEILNSFIEDYPDTSAKNLPVKYLAKSIDILADADIAVFGHGWEKARGCKIEHEIATQYGITVIEL